MNPKTREAVMHTRKESLTAKVPPVGVSGGMGSGNIMTNAPDDVATYSTMKGDLTRVADMKEAREDYSLAVPGADPVMPVQRGSGANRRGYCPMLFAPVCMMNMTHAEVYNNDCFAERARQELEDARRIVQDPVIVEYGRLAFDAGGQDWDLLERQCARYHQISFRTPCTKIYRPFCFFGKYTASNFCMGVKRFPFLHLKPALAAEYTRPGTCRTLREVFPTEKLLDAAPTVDVHDSSYSEGSSTVMPYLPPPATFGGSGHMDYDYGAYDPKHDIFGRPQVQPRPRTTPYMGSEGSVQAIPGHDDHTMYFSGITASGYTGNMVDPQYDPIDGYNYWAHMDPTYGGSYMGGSGTDMHYDDNSWKQDEHYVAPPKMWRDFATAEDMYQVSAGSGEHSYDENAYVPYTYASAPHYEYNYGVPVAPPGGGGPDDGLINLPGLPGSAIVTPAPPPGNVGECPMHWAPVCVEHERGGETEFSNICVARQHGHQRHEIKDGPCGVVSPPDHGSGMPMPPYHGSGMPMPPHYGSGMPMPPHHGSGTPPYHGDPEYCPLMYEPVCAMDSAGMYHEFSNDCFARKAGYVDGQIMPYQCPSAPPSYGSGSGVPSPIHCPPGGSPVCAHVTDGYGSGYGSAYGSGGTHEIEYANYCLAQAAGHTAIIPYPCGGGLPLPCPTDWNPVCVSNAAFEGELGTSTPEEYTNRCMAK